MNTVIFACKRIRDVFFRKIRNKLMIVLILTTILPVVFITVISYYDFSSTVEKQFIESNLKLAENISGNLNEYSRQMRDVVLGVARDVDLIKILKFNTASDYDYGGSSYTYVENRLLKIMNDKHDIDSVYFYVKSVDRLYFMQRPRLVVYKVEHPDIKDTSWYSGAVKTDRGIYIEDTHTTQFDIKSKDGRGDNIVHIEDKPGDVLSFSFAITDFPNSNITGVVSVNVDIKNLEHIYSKARVTSSEEIFIVNSASNVVYPAKLNDTCSAFLKENYLDITQSKKDVAFKAVVNGIRYLVLYNNSTYTNWNVIKLIPIKVINATVIDALKFNILLGLFFTFFAVCCSLIFSYSISNPIVRLAKCMKNIKMDHLEPLKVIDGTDEIRILYQSYNDMAVLINTLIIEDYKSKLRERQAQIKALQSQINPHFLYNTLQTISGLAIDKCVPEINDAIISLGSMFRYAIKSFDDSVLLKDEISHVENYFLIQKLRYEDSLKYSIQIQESLMETPIPKLTLQPIVENAIMYGIEKQINGGKIDIYGYALEGKVYLEIKDNGPGINKKKVDKLNADIRDKASQITTNNGIGLHNVHSRISYAFGEGYGLTISSEPGIGTSVTVILKQRNK